MLHIIPGSEKREKNDKDKTLANEKTSYKKEKAAKMKANAGKVCRSEKSIDLWLEAAFSDSLLECVVSWTKCYRGHAC